MGDFDWGDIQDFFGGTFKGGETDEEGNLTEEGEGFAAALWGEESEKEYERFFAGEYDFYDYFLNPGSVIANPAQQLADPGQFFTGSEGRRWKEGEGVSERTVESAKIAATVAGGALLGGEGAAAEGATAGEAAGTAAGAAEVGAGAVEVAETAQTAEELAALEGFYSAESGAGAAETSFFDTAGDFLLDNGQDIGETFVEQQQEAEKKKRQEQDQANAEALGRTKSAAFQSNLAQALAGEETAEPIEEPTGPAIGFEDVDNPIPLQPTPEGELGPDSIVTTETADGRVTEIKQPSTGVKNVRKDDIVDAYGTNDSLESLSRVNDNEDPQNFYNELLGG